MTLKTKPTESKSKPKTVTTINGSIEVDHDEMTSLGLDLETLMGRIEGYAFSNGAKLTGWEVQFHTTEPMTQETEQSIN